MIIEIDRYSGRPNPRFELAPNEEAVVLALMRQHTTRDLPPMTMGFRCVRIGLGVGVAIAGSPLEAYCLEIEAKRNRPRIVCLCGSTKFKQQFIDANYRETKAGRIVLTVGVFSHADGIMDSLAEDEKRALDALHKRKIDWADEVFVINVGGYIGSSTRSEIDYATTLGKPVRYLEAQ